MSFSITDADFSTTKSRHAKYLVFGNRLGLPFDASTPVLRVCVGDEQSLLLKRLKKKKIWGWSAVCHLNLIYIRALQMWLKACVGVARFKFYMGQYTPSSPLHNQPNWRSDSTEDALKWTWLYNGGTALTKYILSSFCCTNLFFFYESLNLAYDLVCNTAPFTLSYKVGSRVH